MIFYHWRDNMRYEIKGGAFPAAVINLNKGEQIYSDKGDMSWRSPLIEMNTTTKGGLLKGIKRSFGGESFFLNTFTSTEDNQEIVFTSSLPGTIKAMNFDGTKNLICQKNAFMCADVSVDSDIVFTKSLTAGLVGGEGFILQKLGGSGTALLEIDGSLAEKTLGDGEKLLVDQGHLAYFEETVTYRIVMVKGLKNKLIGGEGLFLIELVGPGVIGLQTLPFQKQITPTTGRR